MSTKSIIKAELNDIDEGILNNSNNPIPIYRAFNDDLFDHAYMKSEEEINNADEYESEGLAFYAWEFNEKYNIDGVVISKVVQGGPVRN